MKPCLWMIMALACLAMTGGCRTSHSTESVSLAPELSLEQRREMQIEIWDASYARVFAATVATFQDMGWGLDAVDKGAGIIRASTPRRQEVFGPEDERHYDVAARRETARRRADVTKRWTRWLEAVVHIEPWEDARTRQRIVLNVRGSLPATSYSERQEAGSFNRARDILIHAPGIEQAVEVEIPEVYRNQFDRIGQEVAKRRPIQTPQHSETGDHP